MIVSRLWLTSSCSDWEGTHVLFFPSLLKRSVFFFFSIKTLTVVLNLQLERTERNISIRQSRKNWCCNCFLFTVFSLSWLLQFHFSNQIRFRIPDSVCSEGTQGSESCGAAEEEDEWAGVVAAPALPHDSLPHPQQTWKGAQLTLFLFECV